MSSFLDTFKVFFWCESLFGLLAVEKKENQFVVTTISRLLSFIPGTIFFTTLSYVYFFDENLTNNVLIGSSESGSLSSIISQVSVILSSITFFVITFGSYKGNVHNINLYNALNDIDRVLTKEFNIDLNYNNYQSRINITLILFGISYLTVTISLVYFMSNPDDLIFFTLMSYTLLVSMIETFTYYYKVTFISSRFLFIRKYFEQKDLKLSSEQYTIMVRVYFDLCDCVMLVNNGNGIKQLFNIATGSFATVSHSFLVFWTFSDNVNDVNFYLISLLITTVAPQTFKVFILSVVCHRAIESVRILLKFLFN